MESNISRDHIALEVMKVILSKMIETKKWVLKNGEMVFPEPQEVAETAYLYADAMISERKFTKEE